MSTWSWNFILKQIGWKTQPNVNLPAFSFSEIPGIAWKGKQKSQNCGIIRKKYQITLLGVKWSTVNGAKLNRTWP